jgi:type IV secretory pathway VirB10-like protein
LDIDPDLWLLSIFGAGLLVAGGAAVRAALLGPISAPSPAGPDAPPLQKTSPSSEISPEPTTFAESPAVPESPAPFSPAVAALPVPGSSPAPAADLGAIREALARSEALRDALRSEVVEQRQRAERHAEAAKLEIQRLAIDLEAEKTRTSEKIATLERALEAANEERDSASAKADALERLIEGVRARSRELAAEIASLKNSHDKR